MKLSWLYWVFNTRIWSDGYKIIIELFCTQLKQRLLHKKTLGRHTQKISQHDELNLIFGGLSLLLLKIKKLKNWNWYRTNRKFIKPFFLLINWSIMVTELIIKNQSNTNNLSFLVDWHIKHVSSETYGVPVTQ